jgi:uncharacterized protein YjbI with pentapeptide repeats
MPRSKKSTLRRKTKTKTYKKPKTKTYKKPKTKTNKRKINAKIYNKLSINSQYKTIEYPEYNKQSELVGKDLRNKVIHGAYMKKNNLSHAKLHGTKFVDCTFINVNFDHAFIDAQTEFIDCKFINCKTDSIKYVNGAVKEKFDNIFSSRNV